MQFMKDVVQTVIIKFAKHFEKLLTICLKGEKK